MALDKMTGIPPYDAWIPMDVEDIKNGRLGCAALRLLAPEVIALEMEHWQNRVKAAQVVRQIGGPIHELHMRGQQHITRCNQATEDPDALGDDLINQATIASIVGAGILLRTPPFDKIHGGGAGLEAVDFDPNPDRTAVHLHEAVAHRLGLPLPEPGEEIWYDADPELFIRVRRPAEPSNWLVRHATASFDPQSMASFAPKVKRDYWENGPKVPIL